MALYKLRSLLKLNLKFFLDYEFLRDGRYTNVVSGQQFYDGSDMSRLYCDIEASKYFGLQPGQVWQSAFRNWVYESGIALNNDIGIRNLTLPIICSGFYVSGIFRATDSSHYQYDSTASHHIDWINGRVFFDTPKDPTETIIQSDFAYKHVRVAFEHDFNNQFREGYLESKFTTNPLTSNQIVYPSGFAQPFPAVFIETYGRRNSAYELGNRSLIANDTVYFHIWALDDITRDDICDTITYQESKQLPLIDFNLAPMPLSGIYNEKSPEYLAYQEMLKNPRLTIPGTVYGSAHIIGYVSDLTNIRSFNENPYTEFEKSRVEMNIMTYLFAPNAPLGIITGSYGFAGGTEYF